MSSKQRYEGYLLIDHKDSPGLSQAEAVNAGLPIGAGRGVFEAATYTCSHCQRVVVINPLRTRGREWCSKCNHYICDGCGAIKAATGECLTFNEIIETAQNAAS